VEAFSNHGRQAGAQYSKSVRDNFNKDQKGNLTKATQNWPVWWIKMASSL